MNKKILWIDGSVREGSRTRALAQTVIDHLDGEVTHLHIEDENIVPLKGETLEKLAALLDAGKFDDPTFKYARQFAEADTVVLSAPYWDLSFPAAVRAYTEAVTVSDITFRYSDEGIPQGLCKAQILYYVTTSGGPIGELNLGENYIRNLAQRLYGIPDFQCFSAEGLDILGADVDSIMADAKMRVEEYFKQ